MKKKLTIKELAKQTGHSPSTFTRHIRAGKILQPCLDEHGHYYYNEDQAPKAIAHGLKIETRKRRQPKANKMAQVTEVQPKDLTVYNLADGRVLVCDGDKIVGTAKKGDN